ncbi:ATP-binding cassette domain-containing protein [Xanthobacter autotrophicus]|uniref:ATP-binding cassette domain-containing protein n=1 Tax=Xanthobacter autotrophicus TaxID=280 RepID=UPI00372A39EC
MTPPIEPDALCLSGVTISLRGQSEPLIRDLSLSVAPGRVATIMGPSGSGKSTLLAYVGGFMDRAAFEGQGRVTIGTEVINQKPAEQRRLGVLFQDAVLFPHLSVGGNLMFALPRVALKCRAARRAAVDDALASAGLAGFADRDPATLSGGQKARVALLRTLMAGPRALLLDEPFGKLDAGLRAEFRGFVFAHAVERRLPTLLVTHDPADAVGGVLIRLDAGKEKGV